MYALAHIKRCNYPNSREDKIRLLEEFNIEINAHLLVFCPVETSEDADG